MATEYVPNSDPGTSEVSPSPSPIQEPMTPLINYTVATIAKSNSGSSDDSSKGPAPIYKNSDDSQNAATNLNIPPSPIEEEQESREESLHKMVQSILDDSDNDIVLSNLNNNGYNNIHYADNENTATSIAKQPQMSQPSDIQKRSMTMPTPTATKKEKEQKRKYDKRSYVVEWRTVIFIRHGKSKWNAAEGNTIGKVVAAGQGLWEYYKHKKLRQNNIKKQKSEIDIMDAPLSREGIMESLNLCTHLREYTTTNQLNAYNALFEQTRSKIDEILTNINNIKDTEKNENELANELKTCLAQLDEHKIKSLIAQHPPQDDDMLKLPPPVPETRSRQTFTAPNSENDLFSSLNGQKNDENEEGKVEKNGNSHSLNETLDNLMNLPAASTPIPLITPSTSDDKIETAENQTKKEKITETETKQNENNEKDVVKNINKSSKRYMSQISDPQSPMTAEYVISVLNGDQNKCGIVVSNLRRAMSTACICLKDRLQRRPYEKIQILGCLQEVGLNSDTRPLLFTKEHKPNLAKFEKSTPLLKGYQMKQLYAERLSTKYYKGDASDKTAQQRLQEFALWLFAQRKYLHVVAVGHSHWFQSFFKAYLPTNILEEALPAKVRAAKIRNCGVVAFRIKKRYVPSKSKRHGRHITFEIAPNSITTLQFNLYNAPSTNHDKMAEKAKNAQESEDDAIMVVDEEESKEVNEVDGDVVDNENMNGSVSLPQSMSETVTTKSSPGILAYINGDENNNDNGLHYYDMLDMNNANDANNEQRPKIPKKSPPPIPNINVNDEQQQSDDNKMLSSSLTAVSAGITKSKYLFAKAMNRFTKSENEESEKEDENNGNNESEKVTNGGDIVTKVADEENYIK